MHVEGRAFVRCHDDWSGGDKSRFWAGGGMSARVSRRDRESGHPSMALKVALSTVMSAAGALSSTYVC